MPTAPVSPEKQAEIDDLERAIREAVEAEISELVGVDSRKVLRRDRFILL